MKDSRQEINIRLRYFTNGGNVEEKVFSWASHVIDKMLLHINLENYVGIDRTILTLAQFAFILLHKTQEYKFNVYTGIRDYLNKEVDLADLGAFYKIKNVFGYPKTFGSSAIQDILEKSSFGLTSLLKQYYCPKKEVDEMIYPFAATYILKDIEYDAGYEEYYLDRSGSYDNVRGFIEQQLIENNGNSTQFAKWKPRMYFTEYNDAKTRGGKVPKFSLKCGLGTVALYSQGITRVCDVDILMEIQMDSKFNDRVEEFVKYLSQILTFNKQEADLFRKEILSTAEKYTNKS